MRYILYILITAVLLLTSCAQVPREAVELSATVGRDLAEMKKAHLAFVDLYYDRLYSDINAFIDDVYLPFQIHETLKDEAIRNELISGIEASSLSSSTAAEQKEAFQKIEFFILLLHQEVEDYRKTKLEPVKRQHLELLRNLNDAYDQIHYANSIVTGHLASVVKVHDTQNEVLEKLELKDIRTELGKGIAELSEKIAELNKKAAKGEEDISKIISEFDSIMKK